jgi:hypothetical protein
MRTLPDALFKLIHNTVQIHFSCRNGNMSAALGCSTVGPRINGNDAQPRHRAVISPQLFVKVGLPLIASALAAAVAVIVVAMFDIHCLTGVGELVMLSI